MFTNARVKKLEEQVKELTKNKSEQQATLLHNYAPPPSKLTFRQELQKETDDWLKYVI